MTTPISSLRRGLGLAAAAGLITGGCALAMLSSPADASLPSAGPNQSVSISPNVVHPTGKATVTGTCGYSTSGYVLSRAFAGDPNASFGVPAKFFQTEPDGSFFVFVDISPSAPLGSDPVSVRCGGATLAVTAPLTVVANGAQPQPTVAPTKPTTTTPKATNPDQVTAKPSFTG